MTLSNVVYANAESTIVNAMIDGRHCSGIRLAADTEAAAQVLQWIAQGNTPAPFTAPPAQVPEVITDRQFFQQLALQSVITQDEALAAVGPGTLPATLASLISQLPAEQQFDAKMKCIGAVQFHRTAPLTEVLRQLFGWTAAQTDEFWKAAVKL